MILRLVTQFTSIKATLLPKHFNCLFLLTQRDVERLHAKWSRWRTPARTPTTSITKTTWTTFTPISTVHSHPSQILYMRSCSTGWTQKLAPPPATFADIAAVRVCKCASSDLISHHQQTGSSESPTHYLAVNTTLGTLSNVGGALSWLK